MVYNKEYYKQGYYNKLSSKSTSGGLCMGILIILGVLILDQAVKFYIQTNFALHEARPAIKGLFQWFYLHNDGAGWGHFANQRFFLITISTLAAAYLFYLWRYEAQDSRIAKLTYSLLLGGTLGNLIDRIRLGYVVDMIDLTFMNFPVFNVADMALTVGGFLLIVLLITDSRKKGGLE
nr:signal peptidase II [Facklamia hominis]